VILYNQQGNITEASACNVFIVKNGTICTPKLDNQLLPGITRDILLKALAVEGTFEIEQRDISLSELRAADEVWITSSSKEIGAVVEIDEQRVGDGLPGPIWQLAQQSYNKHKFSF